MQHTNCSGADDLLAQGTAAYHNKIKAAVGDVLPPLDIRFTDLALSADVPLMTRQELPTLVSDVTSMVRGLCQPSRTVRKDILHPMTGALTPGTMTLVLGQPRSGKSSFLKLLSGQVKATKSLRIDGQLTYNGVSDMPHLARWTSYVAQRDVHYPTLTVRETLSFASRCVTSREQLSAVPPHATPLLASIEAAAPDLVERQLGLDHCKDTVVGNSMLRGVSGGERKRVTMGEMEFGFKRASFLDEISTGLDAAATFDIVSAQKSLASSLEKTVVIALLQPAQDVYDLFDNILLLHDGYTLYHGPRDACMPYFEALGYRCPPHRDVPDFLVDVGSPDLLGPSMSAQELATAFRSSSIHAAMLARMQQTPSLPPLSPIAPFAEPFVASTMLIASRQLRVYLRNAELVQGRLGLVLIMGLLYATTFYDVDPSQVTTVLGVIFMAVLFLAVGQVPTLPIILDARAVFYKQRASQFHRTSSYVIAHAATQIPFALAETVVFGSILYWITGFAADATSFLTYLLVLFLTNLVFSTWFFVVGVASPNMLVADPVALLCVLIFVVFAGFIISAKDIPDYLIWLYWIDPLAWSLRALTINQYTASDFKDCSFGGIDYCATTGSTSAGTALLEQYGLRTDRSWIWYGVLYLVGCYVAFLLLAYLILEYVRFDDTDHSHVTSEEVIAGDDDDGTYLGVPKTPTVAISVAPREVVPVTLTFENLSYTVPNPTKGEPDLQLLKSISGYALPSTVTALMGASGAGKTTLMDVIAGRKTSGKIDGEIKLNGHIATDLAVRRSTGYCEQMDVHSESATFREALQFSSMLRQSDDIPAADKLAFAEECLSLLGLDTIGDKIIRGSSVEQMKRLTIGVELAASPSVLFLDEPTSGLDARSAKIVMAGIRKIASTGRTVVCTIHQPSAEVFEMFDSLLLLKRGGETVFFGDLGAKAVHLINYFASLPGTPPIAVSMNPAAWMLDVIGAGVEARSQALDFVKAFASSAERQALMDGLAVYAAPHPELEALTFGSKRAAAFNTQLRLLLRRFVRLHWRTPSYNNTRGLISIALAVFFGLLYNRVDFTTFSGATGGLGMIYLSSDFIAMVSFFPVMVLMVDDRGAFYRERASQTYSALAYFVASTLAELPHVFGSTFAFAIIFYPFVGLSESVGACLYYGFNLSLMVLFYVYFGQLLAYVLPDVDIAGLVGFLFNSIFMLFMGFAPPAAQIPSGYRWLYHGVPPKFSMAILAAETFAKCTESTQLGCKTLSHVPPSVLQAMGNVSSITLKDYVEGMYEMKYDDASTNTLATLGWIAGVLVLNAIALRFANHQKK